MPTIKTNTTNLVLHNKVKNIYNLNSTTNKYKNKWHILQIHNKKSQPIFGKI